jgi:3-hydroxy acid dehydrogenase/malonic semialdehyde reductase
MLSSITHLPNYPITKSFSGFLMTSMQQKIVFITGASSGIGKSCAHLFAAAGARLILCARRIEPVEALATELQKKHGTASHVFRLDVREREAVAQAISSFPKEYSAIDLLLNNAGLSRDLSKLYEGNIQDWEEMIDTNVKGLLYVTRAVLPGMVARNRGHVINIGSLAGHQTYPGGNVYCATKAGVRVLTEGMKMDLLGTAVRVTSVDPGMVETEFSLVRFHGDAQRAAKVYEGVTPLTPEDVADVIFFCATRPPHVNINDVLMMPVDQAGSTQVHRKQK